ncbi:dolichol-phosphate mannosyltransferase, glycosyltransferase family 2 protein [Pseudohyphozyma bogoriensis]|nr:dolichol-phosphate mannosyltransferase, glycosyltransferase family 2 protein [Pseudohyphozyma bogoriensis]
MTRFEPPPWLQLNRRRIAPAPLFVILFVLSYLLSPSPSASSLYAPRTSVKHTPPPQPLETAPIQYSIIVPTYKERANIRPLVEAIFEQLAEDDEYMKDRTEVIIVDDNSQDGTAGEVDKLAGQGYEVSLLERKGERGLSGAVLRGFEVARGDRMLVMDADLQHPPSAVRSLFTALTDRRPFAIGTRYGKGVEMSAGWPMHRRIISWGARMLSRPLTSASDPMTGFFAIRRETFLRSKPVSLSGFKIALELLLKAPDASPPVEVPYSFGLRKVGSSKLGMGVMIKYVWQLLQLYRWKLSFFFHVLVAGGLVALVKINEKFGLVMKRKGLVGLGNSREGGGWSVPFLRADKGKRRALE